jgi:3-oxoacyl-[acyl-carrier protein] reductase
MSKKLAGKVALVTGGSRGIGAAIARALADDGADVAISYSASADKAKTVVNELLAKGVRAHAFKADQADSKAVDALVKSVVERFGNLDILVNNAGVLVFGQVHDRANNLAELERQFAINVGGVAAAVRAAAPVMGDGGRIISIGSIAGETSPWPGVADYSATKGAVAAYTRGWARDLGPRGITVNNVQPGPIDTDMNPASNGELSESQKKSTALGRYGKPEEVAAAVAFLASPSAAYITGTTLNVDGGFSA